MIKLLTILYDFIIESFGVAPYGGTNDKGTPWCKIDTPNNEKAQALVAKCNSIAGMNARFMYASPNPKGGTPYAEGVMIGLSQSISKDDFVKQFTK